MAVCSETQRPGGLELALRSDKSDKWGRWLELAQGADAAEESL